MPAPCGILQSSICIREILISLQKTSFSTGCQFTPLESPAACSGDENYSFFSEHGL